MGLGVSTGAQGGSRTQPSPREEGGSPKAPCCRALLRVWRITGQARGLRLGGYSPDVGPFPVLGVWQLALTIEMSAFSFFIPKPFAGLLNLASHLSHVAILLHEAQYTKGHLMRVHFLSLFLFPLCFQCCCLL